MKELSIEEKAKAYDEAKARMSIAYNSNRCTIGFMNEIFPELRESEDERIRQKLIHLVRKSNEYGGYSLHKDEADEMIAWLEKQGEHANFRNKIQIGDKVTRNEDGVLVNLSQLKRVAKKDEKQGEQKPVDKVEPKFKVKYAGSEYNVLETKDIAGVIFYGIEDEPNHIDYVKAENCEIISGYGIKENGSPYPTKPAVFSEQNPTWSEEELDSITAAINNLEYLKNNYVYHQMGLEPAITFLKSLKERVQPNQEWSEEDESMLYGVMETEQYMLDVVNGIKKFDVGNDAIRKACTEELNWLKFLKERVQLQSTWKPSDEQINALNYVVNLMASSERPTENDLYYNILKSLRQQLKKLK